jgi:hypothetical protein
MLMRTNGVIVSVALLIAISAMLGPAFTQKAVVDGKRLLISLVGPGESPHSALQD